MTTLYLAAPLFTEAERAWNARLAETLRGVLPEAEVLVPQEFCAVHDQGHAGGGPDFGAVFTSCLEHLRRSSLVVAVLDGPDPDSGTCWEVGYAYARDIPVLGIRTDWRPAEDGAANCMLTRSCRQVVTSVPALIPALQALVPISPL
jgi:nucleoside 2-deoxyribosyltransferase